jgi:hypothetical protein
VAGAAGSVAFLLHAGRRQPSALLVFLFTIWVLSPFALLAAATVVARRWPPLRQTAIYGAMLGVSFVSLSVYTIDALGPPHPQAAFVFVIVPPACWLLIALTMVTAAVLSPRGPRR